MSRDQLLKLLQQAESNRQLRQDLRFGGSWSLWLARARGFGFAVTAADLAAASAEEQAARFLAESGVPAIRSLR